MKIAFIGQKGLPAVTGGVETHVEKLALGLAREGHNVFVYARPWYVANQRKKYQGIFIIYKPSIKTKNWDTISHVLLASIDAVRRNFDIIHYHGVGPALLAWIPRLFSPSSRVIITFHSIDRHHGKWNLLAKMFLLLGEWCAVHFAHETIAVSKYLQRYSQKKYGKKTIYIPNGVDPNKSVPANEIKLKFGLVKGGYILFLSRLVRHKGAHYLIEAYQRLYPKKQLVIAGDSAFTDTYVGELKLQADSNPNIVFTGGVKKDSRLWAELYSNAYLFVLPSESEGLPIVVLEAMSFGCCCLVSSIPQSTEAIAGGFGFVFKNKSVFSLQQKLKYLLGHPALVERVGRAAQRHVIKNYSWSDIVRAVNFVYDCSLDSKRSHSISSCLKSNIAK
ncbi:glycosyl transferase family 1 [Candidatus Falkowbacteria bacterium CG10_big_fil_rev_8_21_14_0_10_39_11]|uniref:Glycosyl transferase family 1 n=1 Tax=Candidatus Falkowbacteria bacterium CG10_big_fil_rev_8_21_14_0_10_39_11 TaxID=1974565 RepID=A0A2H0V4A9_9BACT|nr:MAG: glycosyl transferase family 1 [Candidatus Falkowbacteria bacterium CG10_big_fil_rev_8_21_14_0_10_39_11]